MIVCRRCGRHPAARQIGLCADCIRETGDPDGMAALHVPIRAAYRLPVRPPETPGGAVCRLCANRCAAGEGERGYCGVRICRGGVMQPVAPRRHGLAYAYPDPLPTNCCAAWFCQGSRKEGCNLAVFFYGCNFDCLFCQNASHKRVDAAPVLGEDGLVARALDPAVRCICFFGGSPEPQLPFALRVGNQILAGSGGEKHICWEWNGAGHQKLVEKAAALSMASGGVVKFDLKAFDPCLHRALCGVDNVRVLENFARVAALAGERDVLTATTLLVPGYVDAVEVEAIARFIAGCSPDIPYSLLAFHPDFALSDLPPTPMRQALDCLRAARRHLDRVHLGNVHLLA
ncbi:MAG: radical SAM protein [Methanomicrobiaceae archaeon]|nr:radical SAM protein [Methanomicrobiaceae archaeon]MDD5418750.1 radical SAM protein [Methanomicrobiaceae archaeon]